MLMGRPYQTIGIYAGLVYLVYLATDGFRNNAPFAFTLPSGLLGFLSLSTHMPRHKKLLTSMSFLVLALALYTWSVYPKRLEQSALLICLSHTTYLLSFYRSLRRWWTELAVATGVITSGFLYSIFSDVFRSLPLLVILLCLTTATLSFSFTASGSVWKYGSTHAYEEKPSLLRFVGMFFLLVCNSALLINHFSHHTTMAAVYLNLAYFTSQFLLYFANERAF